MKQYITPNDLEIQDKVTEILAGSWRWALDDFEALREWVADHITYVSDQAAHGVREYWQLPVETLSLGTGDCEDFAILLCTLLRAHRVPADEVYVGGGFPEDPQSPGHAFLFEHWHEGIWRALEPQQGVWMTLLIGDIDISGYSEFYSFNDQQCFSGKPTPPVGVYEFEVGYSFWPLTQGAAVEFERYLNAGEKVTGWVQWLGSSGIVYDWSFTAYDPQGNTVLTWRGTDLRYDFSFTASPAGLYKIEILKRDYIARCARMEIQPSDWTQR
jgi:hypothetical protein